MSATTITASHAYDLPYTADDLDEVGGSEEQYQAVLDAEAAELRAEVEAVGFRPRSLKPPAETGTPREVDAYLERAARELSKLPELAEVISRAAPRDTTGQALYSPEDVLSWVERAVAEGCTMPMLGAREAEDLFRLKRVPNALLREEFERQEDEQEDDGLATRLAYAIDAVSGDQPDSTYVKRLLGVETSRTRTGYPDTLRIFLDYELAVRLADNLGVDYHDLGL